MAVDARTLWLLRQLRAAVGGEADTVVRTLTAAWVAAWDDLGRVWQAAIVELADLVDATGQWPPPWRLARLARLAAATAQTRSALDTLAAQTTIAAAAAAGNAIAATAAAEPAIIAAQLPADLAAAAVERYAALVLPSALEAIAVRARQQITVRAWPLSVEATEAMRRALVAGVATGGNPREVARRMLRDVEGHFNGGLSRALNVARTEILDAYRATAEHVHDANADVLRGWRWLSDLGARTCPGCWGMHGTEHDLTEPGPQGHQSCIPAGAEVFGPGVLASTTRWFVGQLVEISTEDGRHLSVTPNHPVLTTQGWVNAGEIHEGHHVVTAAPRERHAAASGADPDHYQGPALIEDVARSFDRPGPVGSVVVPTAAVDFHGDGAGSDVHVVRADRVLLNDVEAGRAQPLGHHSLFGGNVRVAGVPRDAVLSGYRGIAERVEWSGLTPTGVMGGAYDLSILLGGALTGSQAVPFGVGSQGHTCVRQSPVNQPARSTKRFGDRVAGLASLVPTDDFVGVDSGAGYHSRGALLPSERKPLGAGTEDPARLEVSDQDAGAKAVPGRDGLSRFASEVGTDRVVDVFRRDFSGHVYNLQTVDGWYAANGIVTHNCRCARAPVLKSWAALGLRGTEPADAFPRRDEVFARLDPAAQRAVMGPRRLALLNSGAITMDDLPLRRTTVGWRPSYVPRTVNGLEQIAQRRRRVEVP